MKILNDLKFVTYQILIIPKNFRYHRTGSHHSDEDDGVDPADFVRICSNQMKRARVLAKIRESFADRVRAEESDKARSLTHNEPLLQLIINPDLSSGWLDAPKTADEPAGHWPRSTKFPSASGAQTVPEDAKKGNPSAFSTYYGSQPLRDFFKAPKWNHGTTRKVELDSTIFPEACYSWPKDNVAPQIDKFLRQEISENLVTDEFLDIAKRLADQLQDLIARVPAQVDPALIASTKAKTDLLADVIKLASASNLRGRNSILSTFVFNKYNARCEILDNHKGGSGYEYVKNSLLGTNFFDGGLFGPKSQDLRSTLLSNNFRGDYLLRPKSRTSHSSKQNLTTYSYQPSSSSGSRSHSSQRQSSPPTQPPKRSSSKQGFRGQSDKKSTQKFQKHKSGKKP